MANGNDPDPWDAFGSDSEADDDNDNDNNNNTVDRTDAEAVAVYLTQLFLKDNPQLALSDRSVDVRNSVNGDEAELSSRANVWSAALHRHGFRLGGATTADGPQHFDAIVLLGNANSSTNADNNSLLDAQQELVPGGCLVADRERIDATDPLQWNRNDQIHVFVSKASGVAYAAIHTWPCPIQTSNCPWLPSNHSLNQELRRVTDATVVLSTAERAAQTLTSHTVQKAVAAVQKYGYCLLPQLLDRATCREWGCAVLEDLHEAANILLERDQVDIYHPHQSKNDPTSYRELSMREDLRMDIRGGPSLRRKRGTKGNQPWTITATAERDSSNPQHFLRGNTNILEIVRRVMNPKDESLASGNFGRYNFQGRGPDASYQDLRVGIVGGIVSLPGAAEQALHSDTPHLFEHQSCLPAHYINVFTPGSAVHDKVGQTALIHGSHRLDFTAKYCNDQHINHAELWKHLVRPAMDLGDCLLFDCRILHMGLANRSVDVERPLLYTNMTMSWFHDPKNWDNEKPIFGEK